jgi:Ser/Thr protein kinase RdoA (MazF antagonist)
MRCAEPEAPMSDFYELTPAEQAKRAAGLARAALGSWGLEARELTLLKYRENAVFCVAASDGRRYAIRVHRAGYHSDAELRSELQWMRALSADGFDVPELVPTVRGELFEVVAHPDVPEPRQVDLFGWIDGRPLGSVESGVEGDVETLTRTFHTIGMLAARLHNQSARWQQPPGFTRHAWDAEGLVGERPLWGRFWELAALSEPERALLIRARDRVRVELGGLERSPRNYGLIHADFAPENLMVDGSRVRLIDFDDAGYGWHLFEIATTLYFHIGQPYFDAVERAALEGYRSERELTAGDAALLPLFYTARGFTYLGWVHTRHETETARELTPMLIELACGVTKRYLAEA